MAIQKVFKEVDGEKISISVFAIANQKPQVMVLHGAGDATQRRCKGLCELFFQKGIGSISFDFSGYGESSAHYPNTINKRVKEASQLIDDFMGSNFSIAAFSMSGHVAIELSAKYKRRVDGLMLLSPAIYSDECTTLAFGADFSKCIRQPFNYLNSSMWQKICDYHGVVVLVTPEHDYVIPQEVFFKLEECRADLYRVNIKHATHSIGQWINQNMEEAGQKLDGAISVLVEKNLKVQMKKSYIYK